MLFGGKAADRPAQTTNKKSKNTRQKKNKTVMLWGRQRSANARSKARRRNPPASDVPKELHVETVIEVVEAMIRRPRPRRTAAAAALGLGSGLAGLG